MFWAIKLAGCFYGTKDQGKFNFACHDPFKKSNRIPSIFKGGQDIGYKDIFNIIET